MKSAPLLGNLQAGAISGCVSLDCGDAADEPAPIRSREALLLVDSRESIGAALGGPPPSPWHLSQAHEGQHLWELSSCWVAARQNDVPLAGEQLSLLSAAELARRGGWVAAVVPGTVLSTLVAAGELPEPFLGINLQAIPDIFDAGRDFYTFWFCHSFRLGEHVRAVAAEDRRVWLRLRGVNYSFRAFLNGQMLQAPAPSRGAFLRHTLDITHAAASQGAAHNHLAILVSPPDHPGCVALGGQGGDHLIAQDVTPQYVEGWDWMCPVPDRNTGLWDKVEVEVTGPVVLRDMHVVAEPQPPGAPHLPGAACPSATLLVTVVAVNCSPKAQRVTLSLAVDAPRAGRAFPPCMETIAIDPGQAVEHTFSAECIQQAELWWPLGVGAQPLYDLTVSAHGAGCPWPLWHRLTSRFGIREVWSQEEEYMGGGRVFYVNGQRIFIRGGNWIVPDGMLRRLPERFRQEVAFHAHMGLNCIRLWGGAGIATPELLAACDAAGLMVWYEFWITGDCDGRGATPASPVSHPEWPLDHDLFLANAADCIKWVRNHPSVILWCGGNEQHPAADLNRGLSRMLGAGVGAAPPRASPPGAAATGKPALPLLDWTRPYVEGSMWGGLGKGTGELSDGPYGCQAPEDFFHPAFYEYAFNPEVGSVGIPVVESMRAAFPEPWQQAPPQWIGRPDGGLTEVPNSAWEAHTFMGYGTPGGGNQLALYGVPRSLEEYCEQAQVANYVQYRALLEAWTSSMWERYSGVLIWKSHNPWPGLRGQLYDWWGDVTGGYFGVRAACEPCHAQLNLYTRRIELVNATLAPLAEAAVEWSIHPLQLCAACTAASQSATERPGSAPGCPACGLHRGRWAPRGAVPPQSVARGPQVAVPWGAMGSGVAFVALRLIDGNGAQTARNVYWLHRDGGDFRELRTRLPRVTKTLALTTAAAAADPRAAAARAAASALRQPGGAGRAAAAVTLTNTSAAAPAFAIRLKLARPERGPRGAEAGGGATARVADALYGDNYLTLLPRESLVVPLDFPEEPPRGTRGSEGTDAVVLCATGWNVPEVRVAVGGGLRHGG